MCKRCEMHCTKEDNQMAKKYKERCSTSLFFREIHIKTTT